MNKKRNEKTVHENKLPVILINGTVFKKVAQPVSQEHKTHVLPYRKRIYELMDTMLMPADKASHTSYKRYFLYPDRHLVGAFLNNKFADPEKFSRIVFVMEYVLAQVVKEAIAESRKLARIYQERDETLSQTLAECITETQLPTEKI